MKTGAFQNCVDVAVPRAVSPLSLGPECLPEEDSRNEDEQPERRMVAKLVQ
jgi:hypothetical protein